MLRQAQDAVFQEMDAALKLVPGFTESRPIRHELGRWIDHPLRFRTWELSPPEYSVGGEIMVARRGPTATTVRFTRQPKSDLQCLAFRAASCVACRIQRGPLCRDRPADRGERRRDQSRRYPRRTLCGAARRRLTDNLEPATLYLYRDRLPASGEEARDFPIYCQGFVAAGDDDSGNWFGSRGLGGNGSVPCTKGLDLIS